MEVRDVIYLRVDDYNSSWDFMGARLYQLMVNWWFGLVVWDSRGTLKEQSLS